MIGSTFAFTIGETTFVIVALSYPIPPSTTIISLSLPPETTGVNLAKDPTLEIICKSGGELYPDPLLSIRTSSILPLLMIGVTWPPEPADIDISGNLLKLNTSEEP